ncbi:hypothetical protein ACRALDRAFT_208468 [Sodiomyces alcalophilus JCM 7366]|uniref:uncharacterized protein n=1 Tax=Sodiomyces alcalophilus JCM 7366 TaxID=591952 RepID=UPI0039B6320F
MPVITENMANLQLKERHYRRRVQQKGFSFCLDFSKPGFMPQFTSNAIELPPAHCAGQCCNSAFARSANKSLVLNYQIGHRVAMTSQEPSDKRQMSSMSCHTAAVNHECRSPHGVFLGNEGPRGSNDLRIESLTVSRGHKQGLRMRHG